MNLTKPQLVALSLKYGDKLHQQLCHSCDKTMWVINEIGYCDKCFSKIYSPAALNELLISEREIKAKPEN